MRRGERGDGVLVRAAELRGWDVSGLARATGLTRWRASKLIGGIAPARPCEVAALAGALGADLVAAALDQARESRRRGRRES